MKLVPEQISLLRKEEEKTRQSLLQYNDYLTSKEVTSSDYSGRALVGDSFTDSHFHMEQDNCREVTRLLLDSEYVTTRPTDEIGVGTKFVIKYADDTEPKTLILTEFIYGLSNDYSFISVESPIGKAVIGKKESESFRAEVITGKTPRERYFLNGTIEAIITDPKNYLHFIRERNTKYRTCDAASNKHKELLASPTEEAKEEYERRQAITASQKHLLFVELERLARMQKTKQTISRVAHIKKLLQTAKIAEPTTDGTIGIGTKFDIVITDGETSEERHYEMINHAVSDELEDAYVERIDTLGSKLFGLREMDTVKYRKDGKTYQVAVLNVEIPEIKKEGPTATSSYQYTKK